MFFLGLLVGAGIYFIAFLIWYKFDSMGWGVAVAAAILLALFFTVPRLCGAAVAAIVVITVVGYIIGKRREQREVKSQREGEELLSESFYKSHCWNCGNPIDGSWNRKCPDCNKYYICPKCGACKCDYPKSPPFNH